MRLIQKETLVSTALKQEQCFTDEVVSADNRATTAGVEKLQAELADNIIRLHVIANSDSDADQTLKYKVRDSIIEKLRLSLSDIKSRSDAETIISGQIAEVEQTALHTIRENGYGYSVTAKICDRDFPIKTYGDLTFPAGEYRALCIEIGEAKGKNWWCVLFPSLCFVDDTTAVVPSESKERLRTEIGETEYLQLQEYSISEKETATDDDKKASLEVHSAIYDWIRSKLR